MASPNETLSQVYLNVFKFFTYRGLRLDTSFHPTNKPMPLDAFIAEIYKEEYIVINAEQIAPTRITSSSKSPSAEDVEELKHKPTKIVLLHHAAQQNMKAQDFKKILAAWAGQWVDVIFITQTAMSTHVANYIVELNSKEPIYRVSCDRHEERFCNCGKATIYTYMYMRFIIEIPKHIMVPKYSTLTREEEIELLFELKCKKQNLPGIQRSDPMVVWSTAIKGSIIKINRVDDVAGVSVYYRVVI